MTRAIGIDLGTTNSVGAAISRGKPRVIQTRDDDRDWTPSLILLERGAYTVGYEVESIASSRASAVAHAVKRLMGRGFWDADVQRMIGANRFHCPVIEHPEHPGAVGVVLDGVVHTPEEVSAQVLRSLKLDAEHTLQEPVGHAVITVPAYFRDPSIMATRAAGRIAGLQVRHVMPEPTAAALAYTLDDGADPGAARYVLVYDFGGGTFDVSILFAAPGMQLQVLTVDGDNFLGGDDIDHEIAAYWDREMRAEMGISVLDGKGIAETGPYPLSAVQWVLRGLAREAKEKLAGSAPSWSRTKPAMIVRDDGTVLSPTLALTRDVLARIADPKIDRTFEVVERALASAKLSAADINDVVVVGGSTKLAGVLDRLHATFPRAEIRNSISPMLVVAIGAAQQTRMALSWACAACGRTNEAAMTSCIGCGAEVDKPEHDCPECGAIFSEADTACPNPACNTRIVRPSAPVEVLSHTLMLKTVDGKWHPIVERGTPVFPARAQAATPSPWVRFEAQRTGQAIDLPLGQAADNRSMEPTPVAHFRVVGAPSDLVAGDTVSVRVKLNGSRAAEAQVEIRGTIYETERIDLGAQTPGQPLPDEDEDEEDGNSGSGAGWYRLVASGGDILPGNSHNPSSRAFVEELRAASQELAGIADRIERADQAGDRAAGARLRAEADEHIRENLPIVPTLAIAAVMASITEDLDVRRDLQSGIEDVRQAISMGRVEEVGLALESLNVAMSRVRLPDREAGGVNANLLARYNK